jgi:hypothetical protein
MMTAMPKSTMQIELDADIQKQLESEAARLNLTVGAYIGYLLKRMDAGIEPQQFDRVVDEVFGRYGKTMRNLAK